MPFATGSRFRGGAPVWQRCQHYEGENVTIKRDWKGHLKHSKPNRDFRRAHAQGAARLVAQEKRETSDFGVRMRGLLGRIFSLR